MFVNLDFNQILITKRITTLEISSIIDGVSRQSLDRARISGRINIKILRKIELILGDCTSFIKQAQPKQKTTIKASGNNL
jgi:hypothetical protein